MRTRRNLRAQVTDDRPNPKHHRVYKLLALAPTALGWQPVPPIVAASYREARALASARWALPAGTRFSQQGTVNQGRVHFA